MSGHSKWAQIKRQKSVTDQKRALLFTKLSKAITLAAKESGGDPETNFKLRLAIEKAKAANMPKENIERAIKKGTGELEGINYEEITYEAFAPGGVALMINVLTDNKNRTLSQLKHLLKEYEGNLGTTGSVAWMFEKKGVIRLANFQNKLKNKEKFELQAIEEGAEDIFEENGDLVIYTSPENLQKLKEKLEKVIPLDYAEVEWVAKNKIKVEDPKIKEKLEKLYQSLEEMEDISDYTSNQEE